MGGAVAAVESGYMKQQLVESNTARLEAIERGEQIVVGVNKFLETEPSPLTGGVESILTVPEEAEIDQIERLKAWRAQRDDAAVQAALAELKRAAAGQRQHHAGLDRTAPKPASPPANGAGRLREAFGEYRAPTGVGGAMRNDVDGLDDIRADVDRVSRKLGRRLTFLVGKPGLDGHSNGAEQIAVRARDAGMQVVYEGIRLTPEEIVDRSARAEGARDRAVDPVRLHVSLVMDVVGRMKEAGHRRHAGGGRRHHSAGGRAGAGRSRRRRGLHAEGLRAQPHHVRRGADRGAGQQRQQRLTIVAVRPTGADAPLTGVPSRVRLAVLNRGGTYCPNNGRAAWA